MIWTWLASKAANLLGGQIVGGLVDGYKAKLDAGNTTERIAADLASRELAVQEVEIRAQTQLRIAQIGKWHEPEHLAAYIFVAYLGKVVIYDVMLGLGTTDPIRGNVGEWMGMIAVFLFGKRGIENVARILKR
jgi:hypothetical protein